MELGYTHLYKIYYDVYEHNVLIAFVVWIICTLYCNKCKAIEYHWIKYFPSKTKLINEYIIHSQLEWFYLIGSILKSL